MLDVQDLDSAAAETESWMADLMRRLGSGDRAPVYLILVATLQALRDSLSRDEAVYVGAQLPLLLRGLYYQGWRADGRPMSRGRDAFLERIRRNGSYGPNIDAESLARAVFATIATHFPMDEFKEARAASPVSLRDLWPS